MRTSKPETPTLLFGDGVIPEPIVYPGVICKILNNLYGPGPHQPEQMPVGQIEHPPCCAILICKGGTVPNRLPRLLRWSNEICRWKDFVKWKMLCKQSRGCLVGFLEHVCGWLPCPLHCLLLCSEQDPRSRLRRCCSVEQDTKLEKSWSQPIRPHRNSGFQLVQASPFSFSVPKM